METSLFHFHVFPQYVDTASHGLSITDSNFPILSQGDHPVLGTPCWYLHPCETSAAVTELIKAADDGKEYESDSLLQHMMLWFLVLCSVVNI